MEKEKEKEKENEKEEKETGKVEGDFCKEKICYFV